MGSRRVNKPLSIQARVSLSERTALQELARFEQRKPSEMLRELVRQAARERGLWPPKATTHDVEVTM